MLAKIHQSAYRQRCRIRWPFAAGSIALAIGLIITWRNFISGQEQSQNRTASSISQSGTTSDSIEETKLYAADLIEQARKWRVRVGLQHARSLAKLAAQFVAEACGTDSPEFAVCLAELGGYDEDLCKFEQAIEELEKARSIMRENRDQFELHDLIGVDCNLALARRKHGDIRIASQLYDGIVREMNREAQRESADYPTVLLCIANFYLNNNEPEKAFNYLRDAKNAAERNGNVDRALSGGVNAALGKYYYLKNDYISSGRSFRDALAGLNISDYIHLKIYAQATIDYSKVLVAQGKSDDAADLLARKLYVIEKCFGRSHSVVLEIEQQVEAIKSQEGPEH